MHNKNYYKILRVDKNASANEIKKAYRDLSMKYHPDRNPNDKEAEDKFKEVNEAHTVLSDPNKKAEYDNPMGNFFGFNFGDMFRGMRQQRPVRRAPDPNRPRRGRDVEAVIEVPFRKFIFKESMTVNLKFTDVCLECKGIGAKETEHCIRCNGAGTVMEVKGGQGVFIQTNSTCPECRGKGFKAKEICEDCAGSGRTKTSREVKFDITEGMHHATVITLPNSGGRGLNGGVDGNAVIQLNMLLPKEDELSKKQIKAFKDLE